MKESTKIKIARVLADILVYGAALGVIAFVGLIIYLIFKVE